MNPYLMIPIITLMIFSVGIFQQAEAYPAPSGFRGVVSGETVTLYWNDPASASANRNEVHYKLSSEQTWTVSNTFSKTTTWWYVGPLSITFPTSEPYDFKLYHQFLTGGNPWVGPSETLTFSPHSYNVRHNDYSKVPQFFMEWKDNDETFVVSVNNTAWASKGEALDWSNLKIKEKDTDEILLDRSIWWPWLYEKLWSKGSEITYNVTFDNSNYPPTSLEVITVKGLDCSKEYSVYVKHSRNSNTLPDVSRTLNSPSCIIEKNSNNKDSCYDCESPTLEFLEFNGSPDWLAQNNQTMKITEMQRLKFAYSDNKGADNIDQIKIGFGLPSKYSHISNAEAIIDMRINNGVLESLEIDDENNLLMINPSVPFSKIQCGKKECLQGILDFGWAEKPAHGYAVILASDKRGNTDIERLGEIIVTGETINDHPTVTFYNTYTSIMKDRLFIDVTRTDKVTDMWLETNGNKWHYMGNDRWERIWK